MHIILVNKSEQAYISLYIIIFFLFDKRYRIGTNDVTTIHF